MKKIDYERFRWLVTLVVVRGLKDDLAKNLNIPSTVVGKWSLGTGRPHPLVVGLVLNKADELLREKEEE